VTQKAEISISLVLKQTLLNLFKSYQVIPPVIAHGNLRMRGQAFVSFPNKEIADKARREVAGFPLYGKPMVSPGVVLRVGSRF
jgi:U2 small nuclear ribonucleoprotein B''